MRNIPPLPQALRKPRIAYGKTEWSRNVRKIVIKGARQHNLKI